MPPDALARSNAKYEKMSRELPLDELREAQRLTQEQLAATLNVKQSAVSKLERRTDMYVSTLRNFIEAMGGQLEIHAVFPTGRVKLKQFTSGLER